MRQIFIAWVAAVGSIACLSAAALAQTATSYNWVPAGAANWNVNANWNDPINAQNFVPDATQFDERAVIANGGTAFVQAPNPAPPGALLIQNGTAEIRSGGTLNVIESINALWLGTVAVNAGAGQSANLIVQPGGTLTTESLLFSAANVANTITMGGVAAGTATVNIPSAAFQGTTRIYPNAAFASTGSVTFGPAGVYQPQINGASSATLNIGQNAVLNGTLNATFSGAAPAVGGAWPLMQADSIVGQFGTVTSSLTLPSNQQFITHVVPVAGNRQRLDLELHEILVLNVNRDSGVVTINHPGGSAISLDNYSIASSQGRIVTGAWSSLTDQSAFGGGWNEAAVSAASVSELRPSGNGTAAGGANVSLGAIYNPLAGTFAAEVNDLSFQYSDSAGRSFTGIVNYTGARLNNLLLQVNPTNGQARLRNTSNTTVDVEGYVISSTASLTPGTWNSLDDQNASGGVWLELLNPSAAQIGEVNLDPVTLAPGASFDLGTVFNPAAARDVAFEFLLGGETEATFGAVVYEATGNANFDGDGDVDGADFLLWQRGVGITNGATLAQGDANGDGAVNGADLVIWRSQYGQGGATVAAASAVPEPASGSLAAAWVLGALTWRRGGARRSGRI